MWREDLQALSERLDAGSAVGKTDYYRVLHSLAGGLEPAVVPGAPAAAPPQPSSEPEDVAERYASAKALCERMYAALPAERGSNGVVTLLARLAALAGDPDAAVELLGNAKKLRLSMFIPILRAYAAAGASDVAEELYADKLVRLRDDEEKHEHDDDHGLLWERVLAPRVDAWRVAVEAGRWPSEGDRLGRLQHILRDVIAMRPWIAHGGPLDEALRSAVGTLGWRVAEVKPDAWGRCPESGHQLQTALSDEELQKVASDIDDLVLADLDSRKRGTTKKKSARPVSQEWLKEVADAWAAFKQSVDSLEERYDSVVDGANVGQQMQNFSGGCFQHRAIEAVMREHEAGGRRAAVVLQKRWTVSYDDLGNRPALGAAAGLPAGACGECTTPPACKKPRTTPGAEGEATEAVAGGQAPAAAQSGLGDSTGAGDRPEVPLATRWRAQGQLIYAPSGINDDHVAMYLAVNMCRRGVPDVQLVTNDFLRDHVRRARSSRPMRLWLDRHVARYTLKYVPPEDLDTYIAEQAEADMVNGAVPAPEELVLPGCSAGPNTLQKLRLFPPLKYVAPAQGGNCGKCWHFPLGREWICPREPPKRPDAEAGDAHGSPPDSVGDACSRFERSHPTFLACWDPKRSPASDGGGGGRGGREGRREGCDGGT